MADVTQYVTLGVAGERLAVPVDRVREILAVSPISRLPHTPPHLLGMIDVRGRGVPVVDLRLKLGFEAGEDTQDTRVIVLEIMIGDRDLAFGLKTDNVFEVAALDESGLEPPPEIGVKWRSEFIAGIGRRHGAFVTVLDLERLFASGEIALMASAAAPSEAAA